MTTIYHNPQCSKSRATLALLRERGIEPSVVEYLKHPPTVETLRALQAMLGCPVRALLRTGEAEYRALNLANTALSDDALLAAIAAHPKLLQRPIVVNKNRAAIGRPPESILTIL